jgi:L-phenylalanine/L-methionine N-acetyltransferase
MTASASAIRKPPPDLLVRAACPRDAEAMVAMMNLPGFRYGTAALPFRTPDEVRTRLEKASPTERMLVALVDGELVGSASLERLTGRRNHIGQIGMGVHDSWVGQGIGTALMTALIDLADNWLGLRRLELTVNVDNVPALVLYRRFGFELEGTHRAHLLRGGQFVDGHTMARLSDGPRLPSLLR